MQPILSSFKEEAADGVCDSTTASTWALVLSGGSGERMREVIEAWLGESLPKQYCAFTGSRSMLQQALDRASDVASQERLYTIVGPGHRAHLDRARIAIPEKLLIEQPKDLGSATAVFVAAAFLMERDPDAVLAVLPSDLYVFPEKRFVRYLKHAAKLAERNRDRLILLGAIPDRAETDYGWIEPDPDGGRPSELIPERALAAICEFHEKPDQRQAEDYFRRGWLWNTMAMAVHIRTLWAMGWRCLPDLMMRIEMFRAARRQCNLGWTPESVAEQALAHIYQREGKLDFSKDVLAKIVRSCSVLPMSGVEWSDWGRPQRIVESLKRRQETPAFAAANCSVWRLERIENHPGRR